MAFVTLLAAVALFVWYPRIDRRQMTPSAAAWALSVWVVGAALAVGWVVSVLWSRS